MPKSKAVNKNELPSTSTPKDRVISGRKTFRHEDSFSPIATLHEPEERRDFYNKALAKLESESDETESEITSDDDDANDDERIGVNYVESGLRFNIYDANIPHQEQHSNCQINSRKSMSRSADSKSYTVESALTKIDLKMTGCFGAVIVVLFALIVGITYSGTNTSNTITIEELQHYYPMQLNDTWIALVSGIDEVVRFNKPSVFLLLYENEAEETVKHFLENITKYAASILNGNCEMHPIMLQSSELSTAEARRDYGKVMNKYKPLLEKVGVMIVKNLDEVPGEVAQAFHSMCDEYTPLVAKTVFFFTMKVESLAHSYKTDLEFVERILRNNWDNLDDDIFHPLFTRISSMVLRVVPEKL